ncbi:MAG TPA: cytochrome c peroxidase [Puia sp.]
MKSIVIISLLAILISGGAFFSCKQNVSVPVKTISQTLLEQIDSFSLLNGQFRLAAENPSAQEKQVQDLFLQTRLAYKKFEWAAEYFEPVVAKQVNGPPVPEVEMPEMTVSEPAGLQVIESCLFPHPDSARRKILLRQADLLQGSGDLLRQRFAKMGMFDQLVFDAVKLEVYRIITLGITGFDNPLTLNSMPESGTSLESLQEILAGYPEQKDKDSLIVGFDGAINYLRVNPDFNKFNRAEFITRYINPITTGISNLERELHISIHKYNRLLNQGAKTLFDSNAFNVNAYAPDRIFFLNPEKITLGKTLFYDPILSGTGTRSCASCHQPAKAFTDGLVKNKTLSKDGLLKRNTPTLINAALQPALFYDMRVSSLEDQSITVVQSSEEMHGSMKVTAERLWGNKKYRDLFSAAFPKKNRSGIDTMEVMNAIGSYVRSLTRLDSRFDEYMRGNRMTMSTAEINGFNLFMGKGKCATCHFMPLFNGSFPPGYTTMETEVIGVPRLIGKKEIDPDPGRYDIVRIGFLRHAFKTPTVRNAARTAPYMHNGVFASLEQVVDFYNKGGGAGLGLTIENQTLPFDKLELTETEQKDIVSFIKSLDSPQGGDY